MKKAVFTFLFLGGIACGKALAQDTLRVAPPQIAQSILKKLDYELSLTSQQEQEVYALLLERSEKFIQVREKNTSKKLSKSSFRAANETALAKLQQVLTSEQFEQLKALRQEELRQKAAYREEDIYKTPQDIELDF